MRTGAELQKACVVMIPGTLCDQALFARQRKALQPYASLYCADLHRMENVDVWIDRLLQQLPPRFSLVGFSLGGLLALEILRRAPARVERLAMVASNCSGGSPQVSRRSAGMRRRLKARGPLSVLQPLLPVYFHHSRQRQQYTIAS
jgi:pimeloyl-ACP methyl ester carboxylesterase